MKKLLVAIVAVLMTASFAFADADVDTLKTQMKALQQQIDMLKKQLNDQSKSNLLNDAKALRDEIEKNKDEVKKAHSRLDEVQQHTVRDKLELGVELRTRLDVISYKDVRALPAFANDMMGLYLTDRLVANSQFDDFDNDTNFGGSEDLFNDQWFATYGTDFSNVVSAAFTEPAFTAAYGSLAANTEYQGKVLEYFNTVRGAGTYGNWAALTGAYGGSAVYPVLIYMFSKQTLNEQEAIMFKNMFSKGVNPRQFNVKNSAIWTNKLRIRMNSKINNHVSFTGRLVTYKAWGDAGDVKFFDGSFKSIYMDGNSGAVPGDDNLHMERAYFVYADHDVLVPWHFSFGRRPSTFGPGMELGENSHQGGSPLSHIIQWNFDGASLGFQLEDLTGIPGAMFKLCYGKGYEGGWSSYDSLNANNGLIAKPDTQDVDFWGVIIKFFDNDQYKVWYNYAKGIGVTDGFVGKVAMPFTVSGNDTDLDGQYEEYQINPNSSGFISRMDPMGALGDIELHSLLFQGENFGFEYFLSYSRSIVHSKERSMNPMFQFMDQDYMLGSPGMHKGHSIWVGIRTPELYKGGKLGFEYNYGSKYWTNMTGADDDIITSKLATRGHVFDVYYHQPITTNRFFLTVGYQRTNYQYTGSGNMMGTPQKIEDVDGLHAMMPVLDRVDKFYTSLTYRF